MRMHCHTHHIGMWLQSRIKGLEAQEHPTCRLAELCFEAFSGAKGFEALAHFGAPRPKVTILCCPSQVSRTKALFSRVTVSIMSQTLWSTAHDTQALRTASCQIFHPWQHGTHRQGCAGASIVAQGLERSSRCFPTRKLCTVLCTVLPAVPHKKSVSGVLLKSHRVQMLPMPAVHCRGAPAFNCWSE